MTEGQKELLLRFGDDCSCVDGTHGLNGYGFELHTILTLDDLREGYPTAFFISNRSDAEAMKKFFFICRTKYWEKIMPRVFMSDMAEAYYNAWVQVMHPAEFRLYCTWHVDKAWRKNLEKVLDKEERVLIYHMLRMLLQERDVATFLNLMQKCLSFCRESPDTLDFANYFQQYYGNKAEQWAYCYRLHSGLNTNMHIERMHRTIKHLYLHGKHVKRLDKAISAILKFVRDKIFERLIVMHKGKVCTKLSDLRQRHKTSESLDLGKIVQIDVGWMVPSTSGREIYIVEELQSVCTCRLKCTECGVCIHRYTCTCLDCSVKWNMCTHIHIVCKYIQQKASASLCTEALSDNLIVDENDVGKIEETKNLVMAVSTKKATSPVVFEKQQKILEKLQRLVYRSHTLEELEAIEKIISPIEPTLEAIRSNQVCKSRLPSTSSVSSAAIPANKKYNHRDVYLKQKKRRKVTASVTSILSADETDRLAIQLIHRNSN